MILTLTDNCLLGVTVVPSGIPGVLTLNVTRCLPQAEHPRWQPVLQINASPVKLLELATFIHNSAK